MTACITEFFTGKTAADLSLVAEGFFEGNGIALHLNKKAVAVDLAQKIVRSSGPEIRTTSWCSPFLPLSCRRCGKDRPACFVYRTIEDLEAITEASKDSKVGVVIGGGLLGLKRPRR